MSNALTPPHVLAVQIRRRLSAERLDPYERACNHDLEQAVALYEWNSSISAAFHEVLGLFEIVLRNALHDQLTLWHQRQRRPGQWFDDPAGILEAHRRRDVADAYARLRRDGKVITPGRMIAELTFGFWRYLLTRRYETTLWTPALRRAFPNLRPAQRTRIYSPVDSLVDVTSFDSATASRTTNRFTVGRSRPSIAIYCVSPDISTPASRSGSAAGAACPLSCWHGHRNRPQYTAHKATCQVTPLQTPTALGSRDAHVDGVLLRLAPEPALIGGGARGGRRRCAGSPRGWSTAGRPTARRSPRRRRRRHHPHRSGRPTASTPRPEAGR